MDKFVKFDDRDERTNQARIMFNMIGFSVTYQDADMLLKALALFEKKGGSVDISDVTELQRAWVDKWESYFKDDEKIPNQKG